MAGVVIHLRKEPDVVTSPRNKNKIGMTTTRWNKSQKNGIRKKRGANDNISCQNYWGTADGVSFIDKKEKKKNSLQADTRTTVCVCVCVDEEEKKMGNTWNGLVAQ